MRSDVCVFGGGVLAKQGWNLSLQIPNFPWSALLYL